MHRYQINEISAQLMANYEKKAKERSEYGRKTRRRLSDNSSKAAEEHGLDSAQYKRNERAAINNYTDSGSHRTESGLLKVKRRLAKLGAEADQARANATGYDKNSKNGGQTAAQAYKAKTKTNAEIRKDKEKARKELEAQDKQEQSKLAARPSPSVAPSPTPTPAPRPPQNAMRPKSYADMSPKEIEDERKARVAANRPKTLFGRVKKLGSSVVSGIKSAASNLKKRVFEEEYEHYRSKGLNEMTSKTLANYRVLQESRLNRI